MTKDITQRYEEIDFKIQQLIEEKESLDNVIEANTRNKIINGTMLSEPRWYIEEESRNDYIVLYAYKRDVDERYECWYDFQSEYDISGSYHWSFDIVENEVSIWCSNGDIYLLIKKDVFLQWKEKLHLEVYVSNNYKNAIINKISKLNNELEIIKKIEDC